MERLQYLVRRLLLVMPTFLGITFVVFALCQVVPGGPVEQAIMRMRGLGAGDAGGADATEAAQIGQPQREAIEAYYGFDKPLPQRYWKWLVTDRMGLRAESYMYPNNTVWDLVRKRFPVSLIFGLTGFFLSYAVCIPLGIVKALRHGSPFDFVSSILVFIGYAIPPFAFGMLLKMLFCGTTDRFWNLFPLSGFHSEHFDELSAWAQAADIAHHMALPVLCYVIGNFAILTILMKNSLMDQVGQDYVRTVLARGASMKRAVWGHALRNALIPVATGIGSILTLMFAGSVLIERVFDIPGMGLLSYQAILGRDYMTFMGILAMTSLLGLLGRIVSDISYMFIDPRIDFET
jgi:microcin C transport system permease protein